MQPKSGYLTHLPYLVSSLLRLLEEQIMPVSARTRLHFERNFIKSEGCWNWLRALNKKGYGRYGLGRRIRAHRASWIIYRGPIPDGLCVLHTCDNPRCVNPSHLFLGTDQDNSDDKVKKGRQSRLKGERNGNSKLSDDDVVEIRKRRGENESTRSLAKEFGVSQTLISFVINGKRWDHV